MSIVSARMAAGIAMAAIGATATSTPNSPVATVNPAARPAMAPRPGAAPASLQRDIAALVAGFDGRAGVSIQSLSDGWQVEAAAGALYPQQSCSKLMVALATMDAVDKGRVALTDRVTLTPADLTLFHQPLAAKILGGSHTTTLGALLFDAITKSDNTANDRLMRAIGGPKAVRAMIAEKHLGAIRFFDGERALQSKIAGLIWTQSYSIGDAFYKARNALPMAARRASFERYIADPYDGASPHAIALTLARLKRGELLSPASTRSLLATMGATETGRMRVRSALKPGWSWNHKTGTGQDFQGRISGLNDIGLLTAPDGTSYAMAIMTVPNAMVGGAQNLMRDIAATLIGWHEAQRGGGIVL